MQRKRALRVRIANRENQPAQASQTEGKDPETGRLLPGFYYGKGGVILKAKG
jgi:hypothetical protein